MKITRHIKKLETIASYYSEENNKSTETVPEKDLMVNILDNDFTITVIKILRELKQDVDKSQGKSVCKIKVSIEG